MPQPFLYEHQNPHAPVRANGRRFHGYPHRHRRPDLVVIHDTESVLDTVGPDGGAEAVARYQAGVQRPSSYHRITDADSTVVTLPDEAVAFAAKGANTRGLHVSLAMRTVDGLHPEIRPGVRPRLDAMLERTAVVTAEWCRTYGIPVRRIGRAQYLAGASGIVAHADVDPARRSDPGAWFPWDRFLARVAQLVAPATRPPVPAPVVVDPGRPTLRLRRPRMRGRHVEELQRRLRAHGHNLRVDGVLGPHTFERVRIHQRAWGLDDDGVVGPRTWPTLLAKGPRE